MRMGPSGLFGGGAELLAGLRALHPVRWGPPTLPSTNRGIRAQGPLTPCDAAARSVSGAPPLVVTARWARAPCRTRHLPTEARWRGRDVTPAPAVLTSCVPHLRLGRFWPNGRSLRVALRLPRVEGGGACLPDMTVAANAASRDGLSPAPSLHSSAKSLARISPARP